MANSRMKDFYDIWMLITNFEFDGMVIQTAIERIFQNRNTELPAEKHIVFSDEFAENKRDQWNTFSRKLRDENAVAINQIVASMRDFFFPVFHASQQGTVLKKKENAWIIISSMMVSMHSRLSGSIRLTTIRNDLIKGLVSGFPIIMSGQSQSQPAGASDPKQSLADYITVVPVRLILTDPHRFALEPDEQG